MKPFVLFVSIAAVIALMVGLAWQMRQAPRGFNRAEISAQQVQVVMPIISKHCTVCHAISPSQLGHVSPAAGLVLETAEQVAARAALITAVVETGYMPLGNVTQMTDAERTELVRLLRPAAPTPAR